MKTIAKDVHGKLESAYIEASFGKGKESLEKEGYRIISAEENARLRIQEGKDAFISRNGNWTKEGFIYVNKYERYLTKLSPIMDNAEKATNCHKNHSEFYINKEQIDKALSNSVKLKYDEKIPTNRLAENERTAFAFGRYVKQYGEFLKDAGINEITILTADFEDNPFARQLWFRGLVNGSDWNGCYGDNRDLNYNDRARGVRKASAEGASQKIKTYTLNDISKALKEANLSGIEKVLLEKLKK